MSFASFADRTLVQGRSDLGVDVKPKLAIALVAHGPVSIHGQRYACPWSRALYHGLTSGCFLFMPEIPTKSIHECGLGEADRAEI